MIRFCVALYGQILVTSKRGVLPKNLTWMCGVDKFAPLVVLEKNPKHRHWHDLVARRLPPSFASRFGLTTAKPQSCSPFTAAADFQHAQK